MKKTFFSSLFIASLTLSAVTVASTPAEEFDQRFVSIFHDYVLETDLRVKLQNVEVPEGKYNEFRVKLEACRPKDKRVLKLASWSEIKERFKFYDKSRVIRPLASWATVKDEECSEVSTKRVGPKRLNDLELNVPIRSLLSNWKKMNVNDEGTYLKVKLYYVTHSVRDNQPVRRSIGSGRIESYPLLNELLLNKSTVSLDLDDLGDVKLGVELRLLSKYSEKFPMKDLQYVLGLHPLFLVDSMQQVPELKKLLYSDAGVWEGYTIKEHTLRVIELLNQQYACQVTPEFEKKMSQKLRVPFKNFMQLTMSLHDIGKPLAVEAGDKSRQHEFTRPVMERGLKKMNIPEAAASVALELTDNDAIGDYLKGSINLEEAVTELEKQVKKTGLTNEEYFRLQQLFYTADAGSYPNLFVRVFTENAESKCLTIKAPKYQALEAKMLTHK